MEQKQIDCRAHALDALRLEKDLAALLLAEFCNPLIVFYPNLYQTFQPEIKFIIRLLIFCHSFFSETHHPADSMLNIQLIDYSLFNIKEKENLFNLMKHPEHSAVWNSTFSSHRKIWYIFLILVLPWGLGRLKHLAGQIHEELNARHRQYQLSQHLPNTHSIKKNNTSNDVLNISKALYFFARLYTPLCRLEDAYHIVSFLHLLIFLTCGRFRSIEERLLGLGVCPILLINERRHISDLFTSNIAFETLTDVMSTMIPIMRIKIFVNIVQHCKKVYNSTVQKILCYWKTFMNYVTVTYLGKWFIILNRYTFCNILNLYLRTIIRGCRLIKYICIDTHSSMTSPNLLLINSIDKRINAKPNTDKPSNLLKTDTKNQMHKWLTSSIITPCLFCQCCPIVFPTEGGCLCQHPFCYICGILEFQENYSMKCPQCKHSFLYIEPIGADKL